MSMHRSRPFAGAFFVLAACFAAGFTASLARAQETAPPAKPQTSPALEAVYDEKADARQSISGALDKARRENQRVLVLYGANWCNWCQKLHALLSENKDLRKLLLYEYQVVRVDVGRFDKHLDVATGYGVDLKKTGIPFLTILAADGNVLINQETGSLEKDKAHDPEKVRALLERWKAEPLDADQLLADVLRQAKTQDKRVLLHFGAPWCPWCHRLDDFLARPEIARLLAPDFLELKVDVDRMKNGAQVAERFFSQKQTGIPWYVLLDGEARVLATADGPDGNVGYPVLDAEIAHFMQGLRTARVDLSDESLAQVETALRDAGKRLQQEQAQARSKRQ